MSTLFLSDLHLDDSRPHITELFESFLADQQTRSADTLYILGDLVEAWVGDDDDAELPTRIAGAIRAVRDAGVPVYFMHGNRDFLLGQDFAERAGMSLLDESTVHELYGTPTLLMHGDLLCSDDTVYQQVRADVRRPEWKQQVLAMPLEARRALAAKSRIESQAHTSRNGGTIMDVSQDAVEKAMRETGVTQLIHGHTHRPAVHPFTLDGQPAQRIVLGDWYQQGSVLCVDADGSDLRSLPLAG